MILWSLGKATSPPTRIWSIVVGLLAAILHSWCHPISHPLHALGNTSTSLSNPVPYARPRHGLSCAGFTTVLPRWYLVLVLLFFHIQQMGHCSTGHATTVYVCKCICIPRSWPVVVVDISYVASLRVLVTLFSRKLKKQKYPLASKIGKNGLVVW